MQEPEEDRLVSVNEAREWFAENIRNRDGYVTLNADLRLVWQDGTEREMHMCIGTFAEVGDADGHRIGIELWPERDGEMPDDEDDLAPVTSYRQFHRAPLDPPGNYTEWTLPLICRVFGIDPDSRMWDREEE